MSKSEYASEERVDWRQLLIGVLFLGALGWGIYRAIDLRWISDDAFISFRYAKNFVEGFGLVFNAGEQVEGYTNFLWTMLVSLGLWLKLDPVVVSWTLGIVSFGATSLVLAYASTSFFGDRDGERTLLVPLAAIGFLIMTLTQQYATSGLETMYLTLLVTLGCVLLARAETVGGTIVASLVLTLGALTRPDALLFVGMGFLYLLVAGPNTRRRALWYLFLVVVIYAPYFWWRYDYYGYLFPNTYYAKSASVAWWSQGWAYVKLFFTTYYLLLLIIPAALAIKLPIMGRYFKGWKIESPMRRLGILCMMMVFPFLLYVLRVGGDFMFGRFLIPIIPLMLLMIEAAVVLFVRKESIRLVVSAVIVVALVVPYYQFSPPTAFIDGIADEPAHYNSKKLERDQRLGRTLGAVWRALEESVGKKPVIGFYGTFAALVYYSEPDVAIESNAGLTDEHIAHSQHTERGRPGHEKKATYEYLSERGVNFLYVGTPPVHSELGRLRQINFGSLKSYIITYDPDIMDTIRGQFPQVSFTTYTEFLDDYVTVMQNLPDDALARDYVYLSNLYFNQMPELRKIRFQLPGSVGDYFRYLRERNIILVDSTGA